MKYFGQEKLPATFSIISYNQSMLKRLWLIHILFICNNGIFPICTFLTDVVQFFILKERLRSLQGFSTPTFYISIFNTTLFAESQLKETTTSGEDVSIRCGVHEILVNGRTNT